MGLTVVDHPLAQHQVRVLRDRDTPPEKFRALSQVVTTILALEATRDLPLETVNVETPLEITPSMRLARPLAAVPILRAGLGMLEAITDLFPHVHVGYIGLERDESTAMASSYYCKLPVLTDCVALCLDPMLATGGSAVQAIQLMKDAGATDIRMLCVVAAPEGVQTLQGAHPDVPIFTTALDRGLNGKKYILPGLGDFGDRLYGTH